MQWSYPQGALTYYTYFVLGPKFNSTIGTNRIEIANLDPGTKYRITVKTIAVECESAEEETHAYTSKSWDCHRMHFFLPSWSSDCWNALLFLLQCPKQWPTSWWRMWKRQPFGWSGSDKQTTSCPTPTWWPYDRPASWFRTIQPPKRPTPSSAWPQESRTILTRSRLWKGSGPK